MDTCYGRCCNISCIILIFNMVMPGTVGDRWFIGVSEIASVLFFLGLFIFVVFWHWLNILCYKKKSLHRRE
jgi:hypothetical protein